MTKVFRDGILGNSQLTLNSAGGTYTMTSSNASLGGTVTINLNTYFALLSGVIVPLGASVNIVGSSPNYIMKGSNGVFLVNGIVDMHSTNIPNTMNTGSVTINGILKTSSPAGLYGSSVATITDGAVNLNTNSTIDYNANGDQNVQGTTLPPYYNVTFSGSGKRHYKVITAQQVLLQFQAQQFLMRKILLLGLGHQSYNDSYLAIYKWRVNHQT